MKQLLTVVYEIVNIVEWSKMNPLHYTHNGLQAIIVRKGDAVTELHSSEDTQPTAQQTDTCPWNKQDDDDKTYLRNPHTGEWMDKKLEFNFCPTCGKRIEVVE